MSIAFFLLLFKSCTLLYFVENKFVALDFLRTINLCKEYSQVRKIWVFLGVAPCKRIRDPWNFCLWNPESEKRLLVGSRIRLKESGIPLTIEIQNPSSTNKRLNYSTWNLKSTAWNPESKTVLDSLTWGELWRGYCSVFFQSFVLLHMVIATFHKTDKLPNFSS